MLVNIAAVSFPAKLLKENLLLCPSDGMEWLRDALIGI